jgi:site-specific DNA recombinase
MTKPKHSQYKTIDGVSYLRVSSKEQEREGYSIDAQRRLLTDYAARNGVRVVAEFVEAETAKATGRRQFDQMLRHLKTNKSVTAILVEKTDRLHRNITDWAKVDALLALDVQVHLVKEGEVIGKDSKSSAKFVYGIKAVMAKQYSDNLSEEARKGMLEKAEQGVWPSAAPFGYVNVVGPEGKKVIEPDPVHATTVSSFFKWYAAGDRSLKDIVRMARESGLTATNTGGLIGTSTVQQVLRRRLYNGDFDWNGRTYTGKHQPIVSRELWQAVQDRLDGRNAKRHRRAKHDFAYARLMSCGHCGSAVVGELKKGKYVYYHCTEHRGTCADPYTREQVLDEQFSAVLEALRFDPEVLGWIRSALVESHQDMSRHHEDAIKRLRVEFDRLQHRIDAVYIDKIDGNVTAEFFERKAAEWRAEQARCQRSITDHQQANDTYMHDGVRLLELAQSAGRLFRKQTGAEKRKLLEFLISNCTLANGRIAVTLKQPFDIIAETASAALSAAAPKGVEKLDRMDWLGN